LSGAGGGRGPGARSQSRSRSPSRSPDSTRLDSDSISDSDSTRTRLDSISDSVSISISDRLGLDLDLGGGLSDSTSATVSVSFATRRRSRPLPSGSRSDLGHGLDRRIPDVRYAVLVRASPSTNARRRINAIILRDIDRSFRPGTTHGPPTHDQSARETPQRRFRQPIMKSVREGLAWPATNSLAVPGAFRSRAPPTQRRCGAPRDRRQPGW
jgi:hypothetical protein